MNIGKKTTNPVSRILSAASGGAAIYLGVTSRQHSICLPAGIGRAALNRLPIGHFITQGLPIIAVTCSYRALLPHIFTLTPRQARGGYFLWRCLYSLCREPHPLGGASLCAVRTFLSSFRNSGSTGL